MATMVYTTTKARPCHFWMDGDRCKYTAAQCRFAHNMGAIAGHQLQSRVEGNIVSQKMDMKEPNEVNYIKEAPKEADLISLCSFVDNIQKIEPPNTEAEKVDTPEVEAPPVETPKVEAPKTQTQKGAMSNGVPGRGRSLKRSPKATPKATPKNSPKHSPKQTSKNSVQCCNNSPKHAPKQSPSPSVESIDGSIARDLRNAIVQGKGLEYIKNFLTSKPASAVEESLSQSRQGVSAIFSAVAEGRNDVLRLVVSHGANPNARHLPSGIPVLASAIFQNNGAAIITISVLLELGADPFVIPKDLWDDNASFASIKDDPLKTQWCDEANKTLLSKCFNLSVKHCLQETAMKLITPKKGTTATVGPNIVNREWSNHLVIGQETAFSRVNESLRCHMLCGPNEPLVLAFVGPPGHGKTELARRIGTIQPLSSPFPTSNKPGRAPAVVGEKLGLDTTSNHAPYSADDINVIYLDALDKVDFQLLTSVLDGNDKAINHRKTVIILSTTLDITKFPLDYYRQLSPDVNDSLMGLAYEAQAYKHLVNVYGHSIASRVARIIPFVPFTPNETALIAHKCIQDAADELTKATLVTTGTNRVGFTVDADPRVCEFIGKCFYDINAGARSIQRAVLQKVKLRMVEEYVKAYQAPVASPGTQTLDHLALNFMIRLNADKSVSVVLE